MGFSVITDDAAILHTLIANLLEHSKASRVAVRRVGKRWKAVGCEISDRDADLLVPINEDET